jgi:uncharacterized protein (TIGR03437 family)
MIIPAQKIATNPDAARRRLILAFILPTILPAFGDTRLAGAYGNPPISFEVNCGQADARVNFLAHGGGYALLLTPTQATLGLIAPFRQAHPVRTTMTLIGGNLDAHSEGLELLPGVSNYLMGNDPAKWRTKVVNYAKVKYREIYPGVDLIYYGNQQQLEFDFVVHPGANPNIIRLAFAGIDKMRLDPTGDLIMGVSGGEIRQHKPVVYQEQGGVRQAIEGHYVRIGKRGIGFELGKYDANRSIVIDPRLSYSTFLGGTSFDRDKGLAIAVDNSGNAYVTGWTLSPNFPVTPGAFQRFKASSSGVEETAFVAKLNSAGTGLVYSTYLGGSLFDEGRGIAVDSSGNAFVAGITQSKDFPVTPGAFQTVGQGSDAFVTKLNATGDGLLYSTYLGGSAKAGTGAVAIALDPAGNAYVTGFTQDPGFPITPGAFQTTPDFVFVAKLNPNTSGSSSLVYSTFFGKGGGTAESLGIAVNSAGNAFITGRTNQIGLATPGAFQTARGDDNTTAFVAKFNTAGSGLVYCTYLGGKGDDAGNAIAVDLEDNAYVTGRTISTDFPTTAGAFQTSFQGGRNHAFVTKLNAAGNGLVYSTFLAGGGDVIIEQGNGIAVDYAGNAAIAGTTTSVTFPITPDGFGPSPGPSEKAFAAKLSAAGDRLIFSTFLAGNNGDEGWAVAEDPIGNTYVAGYSTSANFPITPGAFQLKQVGSGHGFVTEILADTGVTLTETGLTFQAVQGGSAPAPQSFRFLNANALPLGFSISTSTLSGNSWLSIAPLSGSLSPDQPASPTVTVNPTGLAPGDYYGQVRIDAPTAVNAPQFLTIVLNVAASAVNPGPAIAPAGLVFQGAIGATNPLAQSVRITNVTTTPKQFTVTATSGGANWFTFAPASGTVAAGQPVDIRIQPSATGLAAGTYRGSLVVQFPQDATTRTIDLLMVVSAAAGCTSTKLLPVFTLPGSSFTAAAGWPTPIEVFIVDDCGTPLRAGSVVASFSDGDSPLPLIPQLDGRWSATWAPHQAPTSSVNVSVAASHPDGRSGTAVISGGVQANPEVPLVNSGGVVSAASFAFPAAPSPGEIVSVFGAKLADGSEAATQLPLKTQMQGATLSIAGRALPLLFASDHQVNAVVPYNIAISASQQLIVRKDNRLAVPEPLRIASAEPAVFTTDLTGKGQGHIYVFPTPTQQILADAQHPAKAGDALVIYCEGLGPVTPPVEAGAAVPSDVLRRTMNAVSVTIGGQMAQVVFAGLTPGFTGLYQVNVTVPSGVPTGDQIPVVLTSGAFASPPVTIAVR